MVAPTPVPRNLTRFPGAVATPSIPPPVAPMLAETGIVPPALDALLGDLAAAAARGDRPARDALYTAVRPRLERIIGARAALLARTAAGRAIDRDDVAQEAFLVFVELIDRWDSDGSFVAYVLGHFGWALGNRFRSAVAGTRQLRFTPENGALVWLPDPSAARDEALALLAVWAASLPAADGSILLWRLRDGESFTVIAARLGASRRTVMRAWGAIVADLRRVYGR